MKTAMITHFKFSRFETFLSRLLFQIQYLVKVTAYDKDSSMSAVFSNFSIIVYLIHSANERCFCFVTKYRSIKKCIYLAVLYCE